MRKQIVLLAWVERFPQEQSWKVIVSFFEQEDDLIHRLNNWRMQRWSWSRYQTSFGGWQAV